MKKVVLIGDSVRMGYEKYVKESLREKVEIFSPKDNCKFAQNILRYLCEWVQEWKVGEEIELVHWNAGLWDVLHLYGQDTLSTIDYYEEALKRIVEQMRLFFPNAKLVFATSTAVVEKGYTKDFCRFNADIEKFNDVAVHALQPIGVGINDLYEITKNIPQKYRSDMTHFNTKEGSKLLGDSVIKAICKNLNISASELEIGDFELSNIPDSILGA